MVHPDAPACLQCLSLHHLLRMCTVKDSIRNMLWQAAVLLHVAKMQLAVPR
jgi:hypothetical protein